LIKNKKILAVTGNRSDYDLMSYLYRYLNSDPDIEFKLVVTGAHLTSGYRESIKYITDDGNDILICIENILNSDTLSSRVKSMAVFFDSFIDVVAMYAPDMIIMVGDREEIPAAALCGAYLKIPTIHFFGGDYVSDGHVDNLARNVASKLATIHFVPLDIHKRRLIAMGEEASRIHVVGSIALDKYSEEEHVPKQQLLKKLGLEPELDYALVIYHPPTEISGDNDEIENILKALKDKNTNAIISYPNTDTNRSSIEKVYKKYNDESLFYFFNNLDRNTFVNLFRNASFQIGNSSAGIIESASIPLPVINVGSRQKSRLAQENVLFIDGEYDSIVDAIDTVTSTEFKNKIASISNQYGVGKSSQSVYEIIKNEDIEKYLLKMNDPLENLK